MKRYMKALMLAVALLLTVVLACSCGDEITIGENGNWYINGVDTGTAATGADGAPGEKGDKGDKGADGAAGEKGDTGEKGDPSSIVSCEKISSNGLEDIYEITYSNGQTTTFKITNGKNGEDGATYNNVQHHIVSNVLGGKTLVATDDSLSSGETMVVANNRIMNGKHLTFTCDLNALTGDAYIEVGHGKTDYAATYIKITADKLYVTRYYTADNNHTQTAEHNLDISGFLSVSIDSTSRVNNDGRKVLSKATIQILTKSGMFEQTVDWDGRQGDIFASAKGLSLKNAKLSWCADSLSENIWFFGDSYFNFTDQGRWPSYLATAGYDQFCFFGYPGMRSAAGIADFKWAVETLGYRPQYAVWCLGMNDKDPDTSTTNASYLECVESFLAICEANGITPILSTTPSTPICYNESKSAWVRNWAATTGGRYIDFAKAVGSTYKPETIGTVSEVKKVTNTTGYVWYDGMLHYDYVHPIQRGAQALYMQVLLDFPEVLFCK